MRFHRRNRERVNKMGFDSISEWVQDLETRLTKLEGKGTPNVTPVEPAPVPLTAEELATLAALEARKNASSVVPPA